MARDRLFVKVCGITRLEDAKLAAELGASAIGFIFWPGSPRCIAPEAARAIGRSTDGSLAKIGVFVDEPVERVRQIVDAAGLDVAQLHGNESPDYCRQLNRNLIKAVALKDQSAEAVNGFDEDIVILLDAHDPVLHGGTGRAVDWNAARVVAAARRTILSGGLNARNVGRALEMVQPYGVDVSSGVESSPGVKDANRMKEFFEALNG